jgi:hypothetical protein
VRIIRRLRVGELELAGGNFGGGAERVPVAHGQRHVGAGQHRARHAGRVGVAQLKRAARQQRRTGDDGRVPRDLQLDDLIGPAVLADVGETMHRIKDRRAQIHLAEGKNAVGVGGGVVAGHAVEGCRHWPAKRTRPKTIRATGIWFSCETASKLKPEQYS